MPILGPYTLSENYISEKISGAICAVSWQSSRLDAMQTECSVCQSPPSSEPDYTVLSSYADPYLESFIRNSPLGGREGSGLGTFISILAVFTLLFMLLPTLNLVNINISRIMERSSEIGVRKAFGASSGTLVYQFI